MGCSVVSLSWNGGELIFIFLWTFLFIWDSGYRCASFFFLVLSWSWDYPPDGFRCQQTESVFCVCVYTKPTLNYWNLMQHQNNWEVWLLTTFFNFSWNYLWIYELKLKPCDMFKLPLLSEFFLRTRQTAPQTWWYSCWNMKRLAKCLIFVSKTTTAFCVRVFWNVMYLICFTTPLFALLVMTLRPPRRLVEVGQYCRVQQSEVGMECCTRITWTRRSTRKILWCWHCLVGDNWKTMKWTSCRQYLQKQDNSLDLCSGLTLSGWRH